MTNRKICGKTLESMFKVPFKKTKIGDHTLDFYNKDLKIGLMHSSIHRFKFSCKFHKTYRHFLFYINEPNICREACLEMGIKFIIVPYFSRCVYGRINRQLRVPNTCDCLDCNPTIRKTNRRTKNKVKDEDYSE